MNIHTQTEIARIAEHSDVVTALSSRARGSLRTLPSGSNAQVIPFANAALKQQLAVRKATASELHNDAALNDALRQIAESDSRCAEVEEARLLSALLEALATDSLQVYFQTQHCLRTGTVAGAEALLRLADSDGRLHNTQALVDVAESYNLMGLIGRQMMVRACQEFALLKAAGRVEGRLALNVSVLELCHPGYCEALLNAVSDSGLQPDDIELEITESQPLDLPGVRLDQLRELDAAGVDLAVDDFGTGYASWASLARLPVRSVKLDRAMVTPIMTCERTQQLVAHMVHCGADMGFRVIAEGVQNSEQQIRLLELGCAVGQGFGLSVPKPASALLGA